MFCSLILFECVLTYMLQQALHRSSDCEISLHIISFLFGEKNKKAIDDRLPKGVVPYAFGETVR